MPMQSPKDVLKTVFKLEEFRGPQLAIIEAVLMGEPTLALMPTGMGKSVCFQVPALMLPGMTVVISPLIALMHDQVQKARSLGIQATYLSATLSKEERAQRLKQVEQGQIKLLYVTPERFKRPDFLPAVQKVKVSLLAIDEAHCISQWGHDFRPDYSRIQEFHQQLGAPKILALTASATPRVQQDIAKQLGLEQKIKIFSAGIERPNLHLNVEEAYGLEQKVPMMLDLVERLDGVVIVYFSLISTLKSVSEAFRRNKIDHFIYHGDLNAQERKRNQNQFLKATKGIMLATPAFGMGVDKADIRGLVHFEIPGSLEAYYQEIGRAGRDGQAAECLLLYDEEDITIQMDFIKWAHPEADFILGVYRLIEKGTSELHTEGMNYLRKQLNFYNSRDFRVETAVNMLERWGFIAETDSGFGFAAVEPPSGEVLDVEQIKQRLQDSNRRLLQMVQFAKLPSGCRWVELYKYFGHKNTQACGHCDLCLGGSGGE